MATVLIAVERAGPGWGPRTLLRRLRSGDEIAHLATLCFAASVILITTWLVYVLWVNSALPRHKFGLHFFLTSVWDPIFDQFGALPFIYGTLVTSAVALLLAVPAGLGAAIFLAELAPPRVFDALTFVIDLLAAVPSVIYGLLGKIGRASCRGRGEISGVAGLLKKKKKRSSWRRGERCETTEQSSQAQTESTVQCGERKHKVGLIAT